MNTFLKERKFFLRRLCVNPFFLLQHLTDLSCAVYRKISNRARVKLASKHRGAKRVPSWIDKKRTMQSPRYLAGKVNLTLPVYPFPAIANFIKLPVKQNLNKSQNDPEVYFARNRWSFLLESIITNASDQENDFIKVFDWIQSHTDKEDTAWETYSACERVSNLLIYLSLRPIDLKSVDSDGKIIKFIADSLEWIYEHIEYYGLTGTNNHILNNARALVVGGVAIGDELAYQTGIKIFRKSLPIMITSGGFLRERSSHYQLVVVNWVLDAWRFVDNHFGEENSDAKFLKNYAQLMVGATTMLCDTSGRLLGLIGDISPDVSPAESSLRLSRLYPEFWLVCNKSSQSTEMRDDWFRISRSNQFVIGNFPSGVFPPNFPTHGHCDFTSFVWVHDSIAILVDTGRYRYTSDEISSYQKSALGHNVPLVNGFSPLCESLLENGLWWPRPYAHASLESKIIKDGIFLSHDGFARATSVTRHTRKITLGEDGVLILDSFEGEGQVEIQLCWNFGEKFDKFDSKLMTVSGVGGQVEIVINGFVESPLGYSNYGCPDGGAISTRYGEFDPSLNMNIYGNVTLPAVISTWLKYKKCVV